jgi:hypothetical protein
MVSHNLLYFCREKVRRSALHGEEKKKKGYEQFQRIDSMHYPQYQRCVAVLLLFGLLLQSCRSGVHVVMEESNPPMRHEMGGYGEDPSSALVVASGVLPGSLPATGADTRPRALLASASLVAPSSSQPSAAALASLGQPPGGVSAGSSSPSPSPTSGSAVIPLTPPSRFFTTSSGERVLLRQLGGEWQALLHQGVGGYAHRRTLPVLSSGDIGTLLSSFQRQDIWASRSLIHVLATLSVSPTPCVYVGKLGLLGGAPSQQAQPAGEEWLQGPTMILGSDATSRKPYHIPPGYRYKGCRLKSSSVIQRASLTINYVAAENEEEYRRLNAFRNAYDAAAGVVGDVGQVVTLGRLEGNVGHSAFASHEGHDLRRTRHAGLVLYGITKKNKAFRPRSMINAQVEVLVERDTRPRPVPAPTPASPVSVPVLPAMAIGPKEWSQYFGEVGAAPPLPANIDAILNGPCPFWPDKRVKDTHLLVLVPARVNGIPFTLDLLGELIKSPQGSGSKTKYRCYGSDVQEELGAQSPGSSYWVLMTRDVLPGSRSKTYDAQKALVAEYASRLGLPYDPYEMPHTLAAATAILLHHARTGERLCTDAPWTYTRCQEKVLGNESPVVVGGFSSGGLRVDYYYDDVHYYAHDYGVSCLRKF